MLLPEARELHPPGHRVLLTMRPCDPTVFFLPLSINVS